MSISPSASSTSVIDYDDNNDNNDSDCETHILVDDWALWPKLLTDRERWLIVKLGSVQVKDQEQTVFFAFVVAFRKTKTIEWGRI